MLKGQWASHLKFRNVQLTVCSIEIALVMPFDRDKDRVCDLFGLSLWAPKQVLNLEWDEAGYIRTVSFRRGGWEQSLLLAARQLVSPAVI